MNDHFEFCNIKQYNSYELYLSEQDYEKIQSSIILLKSKYDIILNELYLEEKNNSMNYDFINQKTFILKHNSIIVNIIKDTISLYEKELTELEVVFLSGSFSRGTNKLSSDIDLHFFYKNDNYNYIYEEIVCYIISKIFNKKRDIIDPTFIFNINQNNKSFVTHLMNNEKLTISLKANDKIIKYYYPSGKKRRFYLQYLNSRNIKVLFEYLLGEVLKDNQEWCHTFEIIRGEKIFSSLYDNLYKEELKIINNKYINKRIDTLINKINITCFDNIDNNVSQYKKNYQSKAFEIIYEYISILRFTMIKNNISVKYLNLLDIYDLSSIANKETIENIYHYMWCLEKFTIYCYENNINYGLHDNIMVNYSTKELNNSFNQLKKKLEKALKEMRSML